jgi:hypothetical protein
MRFDLSNLFIICSASVHPSGSVSRKLIMRADKLLVSGRKSREIVNFAVTGTGLSKKKHVMSHSGKPTRLGNTFTGNYNHTRGEPSALL